MKRNTGRNFVLVLLVAGGIALAWKYYPRDEAAPQGEGDIAAVAPSGDAQRPISPQSVSPQPIVLAAQPAEPTDAAAPAAPVTPSDQPGDSDVQQMIARGMGLLQQDKPIEARNELSAAMLSGRLSDAQQKQVLPVLEDLAAKTIFSPRVYDGDAYAGQYVFQPGEVLLRVERKLELRVPPQFILMINNIRDASSIRAGQAIKTISGPFHAVVTRNNFTLDLYLHREGLPKVFVKRMKVGLGRDGSTPTGMWRVALGKKLSKAPWNPPPSSEIKHKVLWGEPQYPLGTQGYWISLEGIDDNTRSFDGYGIHGTNDPESIGKEESLGCVRMADPDIDVVFQTLYEHWSTVEVRP